MRYLLLLKMKLLDLLAMRGLMVVLLLAPLALGLIAGTANLANEDPDIQLAIVDLDQTTASRKLINDLSDNGWSVLETTAEDAARQLIRQQIDGVVTIESGYSDNLSTLEDAKISYSQSEGSLVTSIVREAIAASVLPEYSRESMMLEILDRYQELGQEPPANLDEIFAGKINDFLNGIVKMQINYIGSIEIVPTLTFVVSDYSMEVFFLSIYAVLGAITLSQADLRKRLASTRRGLALDYGASIIALFLLGLAQILVFTGAMRLLMQSPFRIKEILLLAVYLLLVLGLGQLLSLIERSLRLYMSLLLLLLLSIAGGCFFQLSAKLLSVVGQYTPQGWVLSMMKNYDALPFYVPLILASLMLMLGYWLQKRRVVSDG